METCFYMAEQKNVNFQNFIFKVCGKKWSNDIINSLIHIDSFVERTLQFQIFLILSHFNQIFTVLFENVYSFYWINLKGKISSGIEGALASTFTSQCQLETTIRNDSLYFSCDVFKVYLSNIDSEIAEI